MRYRRLDAAGDMTFGASQANFLVDSPDAVGQAVDTRLKLFRGEWFLDVGEGTPWFTEVLGVGTQAERDEAVRARILETEGVTEIAAYASQVSGRTFSVQVTINTRYGETTVEAEL